MSSVYPSWDGVITQVMPEASSTLPCHQVLLNNEFNQRLLQRPLSWHPQTPSSHHTSIFNMRSTSSPSITSTPLLVTVSTASLTGTSPSSKSNHPPL